jgi:hypothetical protein
MQRFAVRQRAPLQSSTASLRRGSETNEAALLMRLQQQAGNRAVSRLIEGAGSGGPGVPVIQREAAHQTFKGVLRELAETLGTQLYLGKILDEHSRNNKLPSQDVELGYLFRAAWQGEEKDQTNTDDDRRMKERLLQKNTYGIGDAAREARLKSDNAKHFKPSPAQADPTVVDAVQKALFFRGERMDSNGRANGYLRFDSTKHGRAGSAREMPGVRGEGVRDRADKYLFVTKEGKEAKDYIAKAVGGTRELLTIVASKQEVQSMVFDVDSGGYKTTGPLTGILQGDVLTPQAKDNLTTWLGGKEKDDAELNPILKSQLP